MIKKHMISKNALKHSTKGDFKYSNRKPIVMLKGGHGNENINYLTKHKLSFNIDSTYKNDVRGGHIDGHIRPYERKPNGHVWFPEKWSAAKIKRAGEYVANLKKNANVPDHQPMRGKYHGVLVVAYKSRGRIVCTCPDFGNKKLKKNNNEENVKKKIS